MGLKEDEKIIDLENLLNDLERAKVEIAKTTGYTKEADLICFLEEIVKEQRPNEDSSHPAC